MVKFELKNGQVIIPTSAHGCRFSDGTVFDPTPEQVEQIKSDWKSLTVTRRFLKIDLHGMVNFKGKQLVGVSSSKQIIEDLSFLDGVIAANPSALIMVPFMVVSALREMGVRTKYPQVLACNATPETSRSAPQDKVWDVDNFSF